MNKTDFIAALSTRTGFTKKDSEKFLNSFVDIVGETLAEGKDIKLVGFGSFEVRERKAREGVNPRNVNEKIHIAAAKVPVFKAGKTLKDKIK